ERQGEFSLRPREQRKPLEDGNYTISLTPKRFLVANPHLHSAVHAVHSSVIASSLRGKWRLENYNDGCTEGVIIQDAGSGLFLSPSDTTREERVILTEEKSVWVLVPIGMLALGDESFCLTSRGQRYDHHILAMGAAKSYTDSEPLVRVKTSSPKPMQPVETPKRFASRQSMMDGFAEFSGILNEGTLSSLIRTIHPLNQKS
ncbi:hypothetical protein B0O80DRAFT_427594, partial [Mortierella sp. GBAus27b]